MTKIYNTWKPTSDSFVAHMDSKGVVYNHWSSENIRYAVGHVGRDGVVYSHWSSESISDAVGHVGKDGVIYSHWSSESISDAVGHVGKDGVVYSHWSREGIGDSVGFAQGSKPYAAGAAFLLLLAGRRVNPPVQKNGFLEELGVFAVIIGIFLLLTLVDEIRQQGAAFFIPFAILSGLMFSVRWFRNKRTQEKAAPKPTPKPKPAPKPAPQPAQTKIVDCPHCGASCRIPAGKGRIRLTCPNPDCGQQYETDT